MKPLPVLWAVAASAASLPLLCGGCADRLFRPPPLAPVPVSQKHSKAPDTAAGIALDRFGRALNEWSKKPSAATTQHRPPLVYIDTDALARRMPQWRLADAVESGSGASFTWRESFVPRSMSGPGQSEDGSTAARRGELGGSQTVRALPVSLPAATATADQLPALDDAARERQNNAFLDFLRTAGEKQRDARFDFAEIMRVSLEDEVEAAKRMPLDELTPVQLNDAMQLELSNLRLQLLTAPPAARVGLQARIQAAEASWQRRLRRQETERLAELARLRGERPAQMRREGEEAIKTALIQGQAADTAQRAQLRIEHFLIADTSNPELAINLPAAKLGSRLASSAAPGAVLPSRSSHFFSFKTSWPALPSEVAGVSTIPAGGSRSLAGNRGMKLRQAAKTEAQAFARSVARRKGWTLVQQPESAGVYRDETATALSLLPAL